MKLSSNKNWFKADDVQSGDMIEILDAGVKVPSEKFKYPDGNFVINYQFKVKIVKTGDERVLNMNATSRRALEMAYGDDTEAWVGKTAGIIKELDREKSAKSDKKIYKIFLEPVTDIAADHVPF